MSDAVAVTELTEVEANRLTQRIELKLESAANAWEGAIDLIREAYEKNAHIVLGYRSHGDYMREKFSTALSRLSIEDRRESVQELSDMGLSVRAIAPIVNASKSQVARDIAATVPHGTPEPTADSSRDVVDPTTGEVIPGEMVDASEDEFQQALLAGRADGDLSQANVTKHLKEHAQTPSGPGTRTVTSIDGKTHHVPVKKEPRRRPIRDVAYDLRYDMFKFAQRIRRFATDDRVPRNREKLLDILKSTLDDLDLACLDLEEDLKIVSGSSSTADEAAERSEVKA